MKEKTLQDCMVNVVFGRIEDRARRIHDDVNDRQGLGAEQVLDLVGEEAKMLLAWIRFYREVQSAYPKDRTGANE